MSSLLVQNQLELARLLLGENAPHLGGEKMDDRAFFVASSFTMGRWCEGHDSAAHGELFHALLKQSGVLASPRPAIAVLFLPAPGWSLQLRRMPDHRVLAHVQGPPGAIPSAAQDLLVRRFLLGIVGPLVRQRRESAETGTAHRDNLVDTAMRLDVADPHGPEANEFLHDELSASNATLLASLRQIFIAPDNASALDDPRAPLIFALCDYARYLREHPLDRPPRFGEMLTSELIMGEIARAAATTTPMVKALLFLEEDQRRHAQRIRACFEETAPNQPSLICPLHGNEHWTLLLRDHTGAIFLFDSLAPSFLAYSCHATKALLLAPQVRLVPIPPIHRQRANECGSYVLALARHVLQPINHPSLGVAESHQRMLDFCSLSADERDRQILDAIRRLLNM